MTSPPVVLSIAGSDCCAGAGVQADLKTCAALGVHCLTAVTAVVAETPLEVSAIEPVSPAMLGKQVRLLLDTYPVAAIKTGMLVSAEHIHVLVDLLQGVPVPIVVDPVMVASTGDSLVSGSVLEVYRSHLLPLAQVVTPNKEEALALLGGSPENALTLEELSARLSQQFDIASLLTGGHAKDKESAVDYFSESGQCEVLSAPWVDVPYGHGTGCTVSAALAAGLASGLSVLEAARAAKRFVSKALFAQYGWEGSSQILALDQLSKGSLFAQED